MSFEKLVNEIFEYRISRFSQWIKFARYTVTRLKMKINQDRDKIFCPDTNSALHENTLSLWYRAYAFLQTAFEIRKRTARIGGSITPLCSIDANFSGAKGTFRMFTRLLFRILRAFVEIGNWYQYNFNKSIVCIITIVRRESQVYESRIVSRD